MLNKSIIKVFQCGGGKDVNDFVHQIGIRFSDGTTDYITNNLNERVKEQVKSHIKKLSNERKSNQEN